MNRRGIRLGFAAALAGASLFAPALVSAAAITWNNGGIGDGTTWDTAALNWNTGTAAFTIGDTVTFNDANNGNYAVSVPASVSTGSITATNTASAYTITIPSGQTLTSTGAVTIGQITANLNSTVNLTGGGSFSQTGGNLVLSVTNALGNPAPGGVLNASGLNSFTYNNAAGELDLGVGTRTLGILTLANTGSSVNTITASSIRLAESASTNAASAASVITMGGGQNTLNISNINIGSGKGGATFAVTAGGTVNIAGVTGGASTANITVGKETSGSATNLTSQLNLSGATTNVQAGTVIVGQLAGATGNQVLGSANFDTGNFTVATSLQIAADSSGADANGVKGTLTVGTSAASTGTLDVSGAFLIGNVATGSNAIVKTDLASFIMNGGTTSVHTDINVFNGKSATTTLTTTISLFGGTLNMNGNQIGHATGNNKNIGTVNMPALGKSATLSNLGGTGINDAGLTVNGGGTLILAGTDPYSNATAVSNNSTLLIDGTATGGGAVSVASGSTLGGKGSTTSAASVAAGGFLSPGDSINTLGVGSATLNGTLNIELNDLDPNIVDRVNVAGTFDISSLTSALNFAVTGTPSAPAYIFATYGSLGGSAFSSVSNLPAGYSIDYNYQGNNDIALVAAAVPEPASLGLLGIGAAGLLARRRRKIH